MEFEECPVGLITDRSEDAPLRVYLAGDEDEITRACVNEMQCWSCHERFPAPLGIEHWPAWVAAGWGNPHDRLAPHRRTHVMNHACPICTAPSGPQIILEEIAAGKAHAAERPPDGG
jgi:hypothetical protein